MLNNAINCSAVVTSTSTRRPITAAIFLTGFASGAIAEAHAPDGSALPRDCIDTLGSPNLGKRGDESIHRRHSHH
jgi:hypothetical protein